jgi:hypothetical protein
MYVCAVVTPVSTGGQQEQKWNDCRGLWWSVPNCHCRLLLGDEASSWRRWRGQYFVCFLPLLLAERVVSITLIFWTLWITGIVSDQGGDGGVRATGRTLHWKIIKRGSLLINKCRLCSKAEFVFCSQGPLVISKQPTSLRAARHPLLTLHYC